MELHTDLRPSISKDYHNNFDSSRFEGCLNMVNKGRSRGCGQCRARKVKCDEARPTCQRCTKSGLHCPGYGPPRRGKEAGHARGSKSNNSTGPIEEPDPSVSDVREDTQQRALALYFDRIIPCLRGNYFLDLARDHYFALDPTSLLARATLAVALNALDIYRPQAHTRTMALEQYNEVVGLVKTSIGDTSIVVETSFLLALCQLEVFEVIDFLSLRPSSMFAHTSGLMAIIKMQPPGLFRSPESQMILQHIRAHTIHCHVMISRLSLNWNMIMPVPNEQCLNPEDAVYNSDCTLSQDASVLTDLLIREQHLFSAVAPPNESAAEALSLFDDAMSAEARLAGWIDGDIYRSPRTSLALSWNTSVASEDVFPCRLDIYHSLPLARTTNTWRTCRILLLNIIQKTGTYIQAGPQAWEFGNQAYFAGHAQKAREVLLGLVDDFCASIPFCVNAKDIANTAHHYPHQPGAAPRAEAPTVELITGMAMVIASLSKVSQVQCVPLSQRQWMQEYMTLLSRDPVVDKERAMRVELKPW